ncbi:hypothetical protein AYI68_g7170 [Smittium mucronatum]|uniref:Transmembrane protein n=1 Tax=Smittium mucronatum TaxID=133383 RepID=A0A1R0GPF3_9FUNG|nr:hypothetical protein AYI68_g7170 [Smittium mucronatum]
MNEDDSSVGSESMDEKGRRALAKQSHKFNIKSRQFCNIFPELSGVEQNHKAFKTDPAPPKPIVKKITNQTVNPPANIDQPDENLAGHDAEEMIIDELEIVARNIKMKNEAIAYKSQHKWLSRLTLNGVLLVLFIILIIYLFV